MNRFVYSALQCKETCMARISNLKREDIGLQDPINKMQVQ